MSPNSATSKDKSITISGTCSSSKGSDDIYGVSYKASASSNKTVSGSWSTKATLAVTGASYKVVE